MTDTFPFSERNRLASSDDATDQLAARPMARRSFWLVFSTLLLVLPQIWIVDIAAIWAIGSILHLPLWMDAGLALLLVPPALVATWFVVRFATTQDEEAV